MGGTERNSIFGGLKTGLSGKQIKTCQQWICLMVIFTIFNDWWLLRLLPPIVGQKADYSPDLNISEANLTRPRMSLLLVESEPLSVGSSLLNTNSCTLWQAKSSSKWQIRDVKEATFTTIVINHTGT